MMVFARIFLPLRAGAVDKEDAFLLVGAATFDLGLDTLDPFRFWFAFLAAAWKLKAVLLEVEDDDDDVRLTFLTATATFLTTGLGTTAIFLFTGIFGFPLQCSGIT